MMMMMIISHWIEVTIVKTTWLISTTLVMQNISNSVPHKCKVTSSSLGSSAQLRDWSRPFVLHNINYTFFNFLILLKKMMFFKFKIDGHQPHITCSLHTLEIPAFRGSWKITYTKITLVITHPPTNYLSLLRQSHSWDEQNAPV